MIENLRKICKVKYLFEWIKNWKKNRLRVWVKNKIRIVRIGKRFPIVVLLGGG